jgi:TonB family protein
LLVSWREIALTLKCPEKANQRRKLAPAPVGFTGLEKNDLDSWCVPAVQCFWESIVRVCRIVVLIFLSCSVVCTCYASNKDEKDLEESLRDVYEQKLVSLRNPYFGKVLHFDSSGTPTNGVVAGPWSTCGLLRVQKLKVTNDVLELDGRRVILALRSDETEQQAVPPETEAIPVQTEQAVVIKIRVSPMNLEQVNESLPKIFQGGQLLERVAAYWRPLTHDLKTFKKNHPGGAVGILEGNRPVYLMNPGKTNPPKVIRAPDPEYSEEARKKGIEGTTLLSVVVNEKGFPEVLKIVRGLEGGLDIQALVAVANWQFDPALMAGKPVALLINVQVEFRLR